MPYRISFPQTDIDPITVDTEEETEDILEDMRELLPDDLIVVSTQ